MAAAIQPKQFWDGITHYSENAMTYTQADYELSSVYESIDSHPNEQIKDLVSMGVADGLREPISILAHIEEQGRELPTTLTVNDISEGLLNEAKVNLEKDGWHTKVKTPITYFLGEIDQYKTKTVRETKLRMGVLGVYNLGYLEQALSLYKKNAHIIGTQFHVYPVYLKTNEDNLDFEQGETISFDINSLNDEITEKINRTVDRKRNLYAQCVYTTDKQFVSHYFSPVCLKKVIDTIFNGYQVDIQQEGDTKRYLIVKVQCTKATGSGITLLTSLNNVLGNIKTGAQIKSLKVLKHLID